MNIQNANSDPSVSPEYVLYVSENELKVLGAILGRLSTNDVNVLITKSIKFSDANNRLEVAHNMYDKIYTFFHP